MADALSIISLGRRRQFGQTSWYRLHCVLLDVMELPPCPFFGHHKIASAVSVVMRSLSLSFISFYLMMYYLKFFFHFFVQDWKCWMFALVSEAEEHGKPFREVSGDTIRANFHFKKNWGKLRGEGGLEMRRKGLEGGRKGWESERKGGYGFSRSDHRGNHLKARHISHQDGPLIFKKEITLEAFSSFLKMFEFYNNKRVDSTLHEFQLGWFENSTRAHEQGSIKH